MPRAASTAATIPARSFELTFSARPTQPLLLQGRDGFSQKGPQATQASHYYSQPQLAVRATLRMDGATREASGIAWLDHEWSSSVLDADAVGLGLDRHEPRRRLRTDGVPDPLEDGRPRRAYAMRRCDRPADPCACTRARRCDFEAVSTWRSPRTNATYPVAQRIRVGDRTFETRPLMNDQELDSRASTGSVYWEGASTLLEGGRASGRGYLEMTGYVAPMKL